VLILRTLGSTFVADRSGQSIGGAAGQRRILALLVLLGAAGDAGLSRDKLIGLLWPEMDADRARHSLTQTLYAARRALGVDDLFVTGGEVRLNAARLTCDAQQFEAALDAGELERAVDLYRGPYLDGFFYAGSTEFEQWALLARSRLEDRAVAALEVLASRAEQAGDARATVEWRKRLAALRPLDGSLALRLMAALANAGDRAGALQHARMHEQLIREALGLAPDPAITALSQRLREPDGWMPPAPELRPSSTPQPVAASAIPAHHGPEPATSGGGAAVIERSSAAIERETPLTAVEPVEVGTLAVDHADEVHAVARPIHGTALVVASPPVGSSARGARPRYAAWALVALVVLAAGILGAFGWARRSAPTVAATAPLRQPVVVAPFRVTGASASLAYLRDGLVELLSTRLADDSGARAVDAGAVLSAWRRAGLAGRAEVPRDTVVRLAARLGADRVVVGSVVGDRGHAVVTATVVAVPSGAVTGEATVEGPADSVTALVDRLAGRLLVAEAGEDASLTAQTTTSLPALRAFLAGQAAFRRGDPTAALRRYERALQIDSTFALAALHAVRVADRLNSVEPRERATALAWRHREALGPQDRALLDAVTGPRYPAPSSAAEQLAAWERLTALTPGRAEAWYEFGARLFREGAALGVPDPRARAAAALRRAVALDSTYAPARQLLAHLAVGAPPEAAAGAPADDRTLARTTGALAPFVQWRVALARGDSAALGRIRGGFARLGPANLRAIAQASQFDGVALDDGRRATRAFAARAPADEGWEPVMADHSLALNEGRREDARLAATRLDVAQADPHASLRLRVLDGLYGDATRAVEAASTLARALGDSTGRLAAVRVPEPVTEQAAADVCVLAQARVAAGDTSGAGRALAALRARSAAPVASGPAAAGAAACAELVQAAVAVASGSEDARALVVRLDSLAITRATAGDAAVYAPILIARLHARTGDLRSALQAIGRRGYMDGWPRYLTTALREQGRYAALVGEREVARAAFEHFLRLRSAPDASLADSTAAVRRELAALAVTAAQ
jgi:DNA-binding SARP family transcriptional activator/TolB-like protein